MSLILWALWWALIAWAAEQSILIHRRFWRHLKEVWHLEYVWLGLLAYVLVFGAAGIVLHASTGTERGRRVAEGALAALAGLAFMSVFPSFASATVLLLSVGLGVRIATLSERTRSRLLRFVETTFPVLGAGAGLVFVTTVAWYPVQEWIALARLPAAPPAAPNVILLVLDTVRASELSLHGFWRPTTPGFESFARGGVRFDRAVSTAPWTLASHLSMFSGVFPHKMAKPDIEENPSRVLEPSQPVLARVLADHGYATGGFSANLSYATREFGFDRGFVHYEDYPVSIGGFIQGTALGRKLAMNDLWRRWLHYEEMLVRKNAASISGHLLRWAQKHRDRPFFVFANYFDAHTILSPPEPFRSRFVRTPSHMRYEYLPLTTRLWTERPKDPKEYEAQRDLYDAAIASTDHEIDVMLREMARLGLLSNTIVVITSDHGEMFGEHGRIGHQYELFQSLIHVPLIIVYPGHVPSATVVTEPASLADLPATILDLARIDRGMIPGTSLERFWTGEVAALLTPIVSEDPRWLQDGQLGQNESIVVGHYQLIRHLCCTTVGPGRRKPQLPELYDIDADPLEHHDLAQDPKFRDIQDQLIAALDAAVAGAR